MKSYADWNSYFEDEFSKISSQRRCKPGAFLAVVPGGADWENYLDFIRREWRFGRITEISFCLLTLYAGVAFYGYEAGDFWKPFAEAVGVKSISPAQSQQLNDFSGSNGFRGHTLSLYSKGLATLLQTCFNPA